MSLTTAPFGTYADITGVVDTTAAAEIVLRGAALKAMFKDSTSYQGNDAGQGDPDVGVSEQAAESPDFDRIPAHVADAINAEIDGLLAAIAAAPTA